MTAKNSKAATPVTTDPEQTVDPDDVTTFAEDDDPESHIGDEVKD